MANNKLPPVPESAPIQTDEGFLTSVWSAWFRQLFTRVGGFNGSPVTVLAPAQIIVGNAASTPTAVAMTGDIAITSAGVTSYQGTVPATKGGTGAVSLAAHGVVIGNGTSPVSVTGTGTAGQPMLSGGPSADPAYGTLGIAAGGTGQVTKAPAFDALSPMTTSGDIIYGGASGTGTRLAKGSDTQVLTLASGLPTWAASGGAPTLYYWAGFQAATASWPNTSTSFANPTAQATGDVTQTANSNMTVTAFKSGANFLPGIVFTPDSNTSAYLVTVMLQVGSTATFDCSMRLWDGTNVLDWVSFRNVTGEYNVEILTAIFAPASTSQQTLSVQGATTAAGTITIAANGAIASQPPVRWTIQKIT